MYKTINFPNGEELVTVELSKGSTITLEYDYPHSSDKLFKLACAMEVIKRTCPDTKVILKMPYVPYSRMDRIINSLTMSPLKKKRQVNFRQYSKTVSLLKK